MASYGDFNRKGPPYRSAVITELHHDKTNGYYVKAFFRNDTEADPIPLNIRNCTHPCTLDQYMKVLEPFTLTDKEKACNSPIPSKSLDQNAVIAISVTSTVVGLLIILTVIFLLAPLFRKADKPSELIEE